MINELDRVALVKDLAGTPLKAGDVGAVMHVYPEQVAYEVEFVTFAGESIGVFTIEAEDVRPLSEQDTELPNARRIGA